MTTLQVIIALGSIVTSIIMALLLLINKMHNGRVDTLDRREQENNNRHLQNYQRVCDTVTEERRIAEERAARIFEKLDKATEKISDLHSSIVGNFVSKEDCGRCKGD